MPFKCPAILGTSDTSYLSGLLNELPQGEEIGDRLAQGCFFENDTMDIFMIQTQGLKNRRELTADIKADYKKVFDMIARGEKTVNNIGDIDTLFKA